MDNYQGWTLEEHEQLNEFTRPDHKLGHMIQAMQQSGFHRWGFVVYRCTYSDDEAWLRYVEYMRDAAVTTLTNQGMKFLLEKYLDNQVMEDRDQLDGASKSHVRSLFSEWVEGNPPVEPDESRQARMKQRFAEMIPRFKVCLYVDQACLETLQAREQWMREKEQGQHEGEVAPKVVCAVIDADCGPEGRGEDGYEALEGCTRFYPGWMYRPVELLTGLYNRLHYEELTYGPGEYERPPAVTQTAGPQRMPL